MKRMVCNFFEDKERKKEETKKCGQRSKERAGRLSKSKDSRKKLENFE